MVHSLIIIISYMPMLAFLTTILTFLPIFSFVRKRLNFAVRLRAIIGYMFLISALGYFAFGYVFDKPANYISGGLFIFLSIMWFWLAFWMQHMDARYRKMDLFLSQIIDAYRDIANHAQWFGRVNNP